MRLSPVHQRHRGHVAQWNAALLLPTMRESRRGSSAPQPSAERICVGVIGRSVRSRVLEDHGPIVVIVEGIGEQRGIDGGHYGNVIAGAVALPLITGDLGTRHRVGEGA